jgi:PAS domain S-box-containing protein
MAAMAKSEMAAYRDRVSARLSQLSPFLQSYALGDFSQTIEIPEEEDEFTELLVGLTLMVDDIKEMIQEKEHTITRLEQAEEALSRSEAMWRSVVENAPGIIMTLDRDRRILFINRTVPGLTPEVVIGTSVDDYTMPEHRDRLREVVEQVFRTGEATQYEASRVGPHGTRSWYSAQIGPIKRDGQVVSVIQITTDITERRQAEEALRQRAQELATLNALGRHVSASLSPHQVVNDALEEVVGSVGPHLAMLFLREGDRLVLQEASPITSTHRHEETPIHKVGECLCGLAVSEKQAIYSRDVHHDPRCTWEECKKAGLRSLAALPLLSGDEIIGVLALASPSQRDFGEQSAFLETLSSQVATGLQNALLHEQVRRHAAQLEERVRERTAELREAQERLIRQEKLAVLGQLAGGVSHELRNPLGAIKNAAYFLNMALEDPDPDVRETLRIVRREVTRSERIVSDLLDFARAKPPTRRRVDPNAVVQAVLSRIAVPEHIEVVSHLGEGLPIIEADPGQLERVISNLIRNAVQSMPDGGRLTVASEQCSVSSEQFSDKAVFADDGSLTTDNWIQITVTDTGVGISEDNLERIFEPLFTTRAKGIGLGLAIVRSLVERHEGTVRVESQVDEGSTFTVRLPTGGEEVVA